MSDSAQRPPGAEHPWQQVALEVYEHHMSNENVGQLQRLHTITKEQITAYPARAIGVLGVAGGNGLDLINPNTTDAVYGYDINGDYLAACEARHREVLGDRLHLIETMIDRHLVIDKVDLLIANLIIEYVGTDEFAAFVAANASSIEVLSTVIQQSTDQGFVSSTEHTASFDVLASVATTIDPGALDAAMSNAGMAIVGRSDYPLPNGKPLVRQDFRPQPKRD